MSWVVAFSSAPYRAHVWARRVLAGVFFGLLFFCVLPSLAKATDTQKNPSSKSSQAKKNTLQSKNAKLKTSPSRDKRAVDVKTGKRSAKSGERPTRAHATRQINARAQADGDNQPEPNKSNLSDVRAKIQSLSRDLSKTEKSKVAVSDQLRQTEAAISETNQRLQKLTTERQTVEDRLAALQAENKRLAEQTVAQQEQLSRLLNRQFVGGDADALSVLLSGRDPHLIARDQYFLTQLSHAKADLVQDLKVTARAQQQVTKAVSQQQLRLTDIATQQQASRDQLVAQQKQREATLAELATQIRGQRNELANLRRDEQRLTKIIENIAAAVRKSAAQKAAAEAAEKAATLRAVAKGGNKSGKVGAGETASKIEPSRPQTPVKPPIVRNYEPGRVGGEFSALRGRLRMPVSGQVVGRFGSARAESGAAWKGLFIRADEGAPVRTVATGRVVFAEWLRGFGNLLIIDHGDDFLSVYGNNDALQVSVGTTVTAGQTIALAGNSGGHPEPGLYFELRHRGQAFDPRKWLGER
ncbi:MAG: peptidoglycan DD-metalloendopeptidase family protein [Rugosibacter sp.]|nr:peptidoglycan DD-metalloendopeptidase family protein [Rugosibacter sp.]